MIPVPKKWCTYTEQPEDSLAYTEKMNRIYTRFASAYDGFIRVMPFWSRWLVQVLPYCGPGRILEVSFGPGWLLTRYDEQAKIYGLDYNGTMVQRAKVKVLKKGRKAKLIQGDVAAMPYPDGIFDTVVNTMAFSGYPDGQKALEEMLRVLKPGGQLLLLDYDYPENRNFMGWLTVRFIEACGDIMKNITGLLEDAGVDYERMTLGAFGSVQLFIVKKDKR